MNAEALIAALALPESARVDRRVPKKTLSEHGATRSAARRQINEGIEAMHWIAALKPANCGVPAHVDAEREYLEIAILDVRLRSAGKPAQIVPLIHRAIPYPALLVASHEDGVGLSLAHKRRSQAERGQFVVDGDLITLQFAEQVSAHTEQEFLTAIGLAEQPRATLFQLYQGWIDTTLAMQAAALLGSFSLPETSDHASARQEALRDCQRLESEMAALRVAAARETQVPRLTDINLQLRKLADAHAAARARM